MSPERYEELYNGDSDKLTIEEINSGWRFCNDCDGLLININTEPCACFHE